MRGDTFKSVLTMKQKLPGDIGASRPTSGKSPNVGTSSTKKRLTMRASRQGGRRRFAIEQRGAQKYLLLEMKDRIRQWRIGRGLPKTPDEGRTIFSEEDASAGSLEKLMKRKKESVMTGDVGNYDLIEGSHDGDFLRVYLSGRRNKGEWTLSREGKRWQLVK
jgi:hypothetical protein